MTGFRTSPWGIDLVLVAETDGYELGRQDPGHFGRCRHNYRTPAEWAAWLRGWRAGQEELLDAQARLRYNSTADGN